MELLGFDWRDVLVALAVAVAIYLLVLLLQLARLRRRKARKAEADVATAPAGDWSAQWVTGTAAAASAEPPVASAPAEPLVSFDEQLSESRVELELRQLRQEVDVLRRELEELKAARRVSPQYADAMALARRGYDAQGIAAECGIAVAEAELVLALSRDRAHFDDEVDDGGRNPAGQ